MDERVTLWIFGTIVGAQIAVMGALIKALWHHVVHCRSIESGMARIEATLERVVTDIGTHETGIRGILHGAANELTRLDGRVSRLERRRP